jgi:methylglutaconyl-CoA hydratase
MFEKNKQKDVFTITLNRPEVHNAFNDEFIKSLIATLADIYEDQEIRLLVLKANGKSFCAGADLNWMKKMKGYSFEDNLQDSLNLAELFASFARLDIPILGIVQGHALGGGVGIVSICDFVLAVKNAKFGFTEARLGLAPAVIAPHVIRKIGETHARAWFYSGEIFNSQTALSMGLVHEVCEVEDLANREEELRKSFLKAGPQTGITIKKFFKKLASLDDNKKGHFCAETIANLRIQKEAQEGMSALLEKRKPNWVRE